MTRVLGTLESLTIISTPYRESLELSASQILAKEALSVSAPMEMKQRGDS